ncbi:MAG: Hsp33 family molecular chaperone HslO [bacterium]
MDKILIATMYDDTVRMYVADTTNTVKRAHELHQTMQTSIAALGRTLTATSMMGAMLKDDQTIAVQIQGDGPIGKIVAESDASGNVVGYCGNPGIYLKYNKTGKLNVRDAVGTTGTLSVTTDLKLKEPFTSSVELIDGEIAMDFTYYFTQSMQTPSSVSLGVLVSEDNQVLVSGGFIIQIMPNCTDETITKLEEILGNIKPMSTMLAEQMSCEDIIKLISDDYKLLEEKHVEFKCRCSKKSFKRGLRTLSVGFLEDLLNNEKSIECKCQYCGTAYVIEEMELKAMVNVLKGDI